MKKQPITTANPGSPEQQEGAMRQQIEHFLSTLQRSPRTIATYRNALEQFLRIVGEDAELNTETYIRFLKAIQEKSPATQVVYRTAVMRFYAFSRSGNWIELKEATEHYSRRQGKRIVRFDRDAIEKIITNYEQMLPDPQAGALARLTLLRDRAFILTLADTGLRISEACALRRGDLDWKEQRAVIIGKGDKQAVVRFSNRALEALRLYLRERDAHYPPARMPLASQPLFARHDIRASKRIRPITSGAMWKAIKGRMAEIGVDPRQVRIHDFRHYFVTITYLAKGNLKLSQELARHESITTTSRYAHFSGELDAAYDEIFNQKRPASEQTQEELPQQ
uniref:Tyrosine recombinase XerC n=1 Tax=uncultured Chloroflexota bacterium TaxID=166587 RepID=H5SM17_9CHLR|nr:tyrosine recombinase XerC [uncultured Chloroflexota bacterium]